LRNNIVKSNATMLSISYNLLRSEIVLLYRVETL